MPQSGEASFALRLPLGTFEFENVLPARRIVVAIALAEFWAEGTNHRKETKR